MDQSRHYGESARILATPDAVFGYIDDHSRFSSHMNQPSVMMGGGSMKVETDAGRGQRVGSHIRLSGRAFGVTIALDEVVTRHDPPYHKTWKTVGSPQLLVVGSYDMGIELKPQGQQSRLRVFINYKLPARNRWLGVLLSGIYAKWCVRQMLNGARAEFSRPTA